MGDALASSRHDLPRLDHSTGLLVLMLFALVALAALVLLTGWTAWRVYRQPTTGRLAEHGLLLLLWLWVWVSMAPANRAQWGYWLPALFLLHLLVLAGWLLAAQRAR